MSRIEVVLGVDVGGTNTVLGYVDREGHILARSSILTNAHRPAGEFFARIAEEAKTLLRSSEQRLALVGMGIGAPNGNYYKGTIEQPPNLSWGFVEVIQETKKFFSVPVAVTNDANAAALGEMIFGAAKGMKDFIVITLGTGLGSGIVAHGALIYGSDGFAGEIGHTIVDPDGRECGCGRRGCLEAYASANGIRRTVSELLCNSTEVTELRTVPFQALTAKMIAEFASKGDRVALEAFRITGKILGMKLADSVAHLSPEAIILFGGLAESGDLIFRPTRHYMEEFMLNIFKGKVKLLPSALAPGEAPVLGSAALLWNELEKNPHRETVVA